jgi:hypothetical protein
VHDTVDLEERGVPSVYIATTEFIDGAQAQARALGADPAALFVPHPIQDRTNEELVAIAEEAFERLLEVMLDGGTGKN